MLTTRIWGLDEQPVQAHRIRKTIGVETTLANDVCDEAACLTVLQQLLPELERRFQLACPAEQVMGQGIKLKFADFHQTTVYRSQGGYQPALFVPLLKEGLQRAQGRSVRLLGLVVGLPKRVKLINSRWICCERVKFLFIKSIIYPYLYDVGILA